MSMNNSHTPDGQGVLIYNGEMILIYTKEVNLSFDNFSIGSFKGSKKGKLYLTSHRIIFVNSHTSDALRSFAMPFHCVHDVKLEQPVLGANYLKGCVDAQPGGGFDGTITFKLTFNRGGCIDFGKSLLRANQLASQFQSYNAPPPYAAPGGQFFQPPPAYYTTQGGNYNGLAIPTQSFPDAPAPGEIYMYETPPPYAGIGPTPPPYAPQGASHGQPVDAPPPPGWRSNVSGNPPTYEQVTGVKS